MYLLLIGIVLSLLKYLEVGFFASVSWWWMLVPFVLAVLWWTWADNSGYTKRKEMEKIDERKKARIEKQRQALGLKTRKR